MWQYTAKLKLPLKSILEEYKCGKARLLSMLEDSEDPVVKTVQPNIKTGRKWKVVEGLDETKECLKIKEVIGPTQTDRKGLGSSTLGSQQGRWTNWENALRKSLAWNKILHMASLRISFLIRSVHDLLLSNANLVRWRKKEDHTCPLCQGKQTTGLS